MNFPEIAKDKKKQTDKQILVYKNVRLTIRIANRQTLILLFNTETRSI